MFSVAEPIWSALAPAAKSAAATAVTKSERRIEINMR